MSEPTDQATFERANRLFFRLYQCANLLHKNGTRALDAFGTTTQQWAVIGALARPQVRAEGMTVKDLMAYLMVSRQNLSAVLDRLETRDWLERVRDVADGRSRRVRLTESGIANWTAMQAPIAAFYAASLNHLTGADQSEFATLLERLRKGLDAA
ncbi:MAG: MarR family transcriptional regulator [Proteobacteria bacterium]|nr:MarR family transcriptional regulator [Pseudomonadota bacterium]